MKELFVPYNIALQAKEKGFTTDIWFAWRFSDGSGENHYETRLKLSELMLGIPLYQQLLDWFREKHKIHIFVRSMAYGYYGVHDNTIEPETWNKDKRWNGDYYKNYYEALNQALEAAFKLI